MSGRAAVAEELKALPSGGAALEPATLTGAGRAAGLLIN